MVLVGVSVACFMGCFRVHPVMVQTALLKGTSRDLCVPLKCREGTASVL